MNESEFKNFWKPYKFRGRIGYMLRVGQNMSMFMELLQRGNLVQTQLLLGRGLAVARQFIYMVPPKNPPMTEDEVLRAAATSAFRQTERYLKHKETVFHGWVSDLALKAKQCSGIMYEPDAQDEIAAD